MDNDKLKSLIKKHALANAIKFKGKPNHGAVLGQVVKDMPEVKSDMARLNKQIFEIIDIITKLTVKEQEKE